MVFKNPTEDHKYLSSTDIEKQENLSKELLQSLTPKELSLSSLESQYGPRPPFNFTELMDWYLKAFKPYLNSSDTSKLNKFVHNRIIVDGQFLHFCRLNNITVECLFKESIVSWKTDNNYEKFFAQGAFLIKNKDTEFLHIAAFHKGCQYEDEISFFVIASEKNYESYLKLRNSFDEWVQQRDRSNLHIRVIGGDDISYTREHSWDDLFLPKEMKTEIKNAIEGFLFSQDFYVKNKIPWKTGILLYGNAGCGKTSLIRTLMSVYNFKPVTIVSEADNDMIREAFTYAEEQSPSLLYFEDLDSLFDRGIDISTFLNLMDGIATKNGIVVVATANNISKLKANITDRPSRFDRKYEIPLPTKEMVHIYLNRWFDKLITPAKCKELSKQAEQYEFSYAYLKELYISSMFEALSHNRKAPTIKDIDNAFNRLIRDKNLLSSRTIKTKNYLK